MFKILLAEDEEIIRNGLINLIDWKTCGFEIAGSAEDGDEAWQMYLELRPDVVITDIKMPQSSGIDLLKKIKADNPEVFVLLLSGHEEFEFARTGIRYGAFEYISKLNVMHEINGILQRLYQHLSERKSIRSDYAALERVANENTLELMIRGEWPDTLLESVKFCSIIAICGQKENLTLPVENITTLVKDNLTLLIIHLPGEDARCPTNSLLQKLGEGRDTCGISGTVPAHRAPEALYAALKDLDIKILRKYFPMQKRLHEISFGDAVILERYEQIANILSVESLQTVFMDNIYFLQFHSYCRERLELLFSRDPDNPETIGREELPAMLYRFYSMVDMRYWMLNKAERFCKSAIIRQREARLCDIDKALSFIDSHYHEDIDAALVAGYIYLSPQHFSIKFKNTVGEGFSSYLRKKRLQKACALLELTATPVTEVASAVGYDDDKYFYRVFKKEMSISPNDYRKQKQEKKGGNYVKTNTDC